MNFIKNIFCRKTPNAKTKTVEAIQNLHQTENDLLKKQEGLEQKITEELENARKNGLQNKRIALHALKKKKRYEKQLRDIDDTLSAIALQREALQNTEIETAIIPALKEFSGAMTEAFKNLNIEMVKEIAEESADEQAILDEIENALTMPGERGNDVKDSDLEQELEQLICDEGLVNKLPDVPIDNLTKSTSISKLTKIKLNS